MSRIIIIIMFMSRGNGFRIRLLELSGIEISSGSADNEGFIELYKYRRGVCVRTYSKLFDGYLLQKFFFCKSLEMKSTVVTLPAFPLSLMIATMMACFERAMRMDLGPFLPTTWLPEPRASVFR